MKNIETVHDERVASATKHWALRFVSNGIELGAFQSTIQRIERWEQWCAEWGVTARHYEELAEAAEARGQMLTAGESWVRAAMCWHFGKFVFMDDLAEQRAAHDRTVADFQKGMSTLEPPAERVEIPYGRHLLAGILRRPSGVEKPPVVVMVPGLDSTKEELQATADHILRRGMATVAIDGPGQGEAEYELPIEPAYERPVAAVIDWVERRDDLDPSRAGLYGISLGGYYALRAAAHENRLKAIVSNSGPFKFGDIWDQLPLVTRQAFTQRSGASDDTDARRRADLLTLEGIERVLCPTLLISGKLDRVIPYSEAQRSARIAGVELVTYEDGNHGITNHAFESRAMLADWMKRSLGG
ncbi:MAG TPA: alpha/beta fold hydrolase [Candidatus Dormibacteraeota bacterium]|nr:alpha/beta fold hydrolase [Candidatus Dormibacteraeota bacterium]